MESTIFGTLKDTRILKKPVHAKTNNFFLSWKGPLTPPCFTVPVVANFGIFGPFLCVFFTAKYSLNMLQKIVYWIFPPKELTMVREWRQLGARALHSHKLPVSTELSKKDQTFPVLFPNGHTSMRWRKWKENKCLMRCFHVTWPKHKFVQKIVQSICIKVFASIISTNWKWMSAHICGSWDIWISKNLDYLIL